MKNRNPRTIMLVFLLVVVIGGGVWYFMSRQSAAAAGVLTASGTVETTDYSVAPELAAKVLDVAVSEGETVKAGEVLVRLDDTLLQAQRKQAVAALETAKGGLTAAGVTVASAQAQYDIAMNAALAQDKKDRVADWFATTPGQFDLPLWYFQKDQQIAAAQAEVEAAEAALTAAREKLKSVEAKTSSGDFISAEKDLLEARATFLVAKQVVDLTGGVTGSSANVTLPKGLPYRAQIRLHKLLDDNQSDLHDSAQASYDDAKNALDEAQEAYDEALTTDGATDVLKARADVAVAQERYYTAQDMLRSLQTGAQSLQVDAAQKALDQANAGAMQAQLAVDQAQANLDLIDAQLAKTVVTAPVDGVVLTRTAEPGNVVNAGGILLTLGRLDELTITVYVPEDRVGEVSLGQHANVTVDSFPGETFTAVVTYISDQAEFTPRNVQTVEGRKNTVFAVKLKLGDTGGKIKPGMPADVVFGTKE
jgi:HlyD family secretion protein